MQVREGRKKRKEREGMKKEELKREEERRGKPDCNPNFKV